MSFITVSTGGFYPSIPTKNGTTLGSIPATIGTWAPTPTTSSQPIEVHDTFIEDDPSPGDDGYFWRTTVGPHILVEPGKLTLPDGRVITRDKFNQPLRYELIEAIKYALQVRCKDILCKGVVNGGNIGGGDPNHLDCVMWPVPINGLVIQSADRNAQATIVQLNLLGDIRRASGETGIRKIMFKNLILSNTHWTTTNSSSRSAVLSYSDSWLGLIGFHDNTFVAADPNAFNGDGMMWGIRGNGRARWDIRRNKFPRMKEHKGYFDSVGADNGGPTYITDNEALGPTGRTEWQFVNRQDPNNGGGPTSGGSIYIQRNKCWVDGHGGGGAAITVAGHTGQVYIEENDILAENQESGITIYSDLAHGIWKNANGFSTTYARLISNKILGKNLDRAAMALSGIEELIIDEFDVTANKAAIDLWNNNGGPIDNGKVIITAGYPNKLSSYTGFKTPVKMKYKNVVLNDAQCDKYGGTV